MKKAFLIVVCCTFHIVCGLGMTMLWENTGMFPNVSHCSNA